MRYKTQDYNMAMSRKGMRIGEAVALVVSDVDFSRQTISITKNVPSGTGELEDSAKSPAGEREIEFSSEEFKTRLQEMIRARKERCLADGKVLRLHLFPNEAGNGMDYSNFLKKWNRASALAGVRAIRPHYLRHTWASHQLEARESIRKVDFYGRSFSRRNSLIASETALACAGASSEFSGPNSRVIAVPGTSV